MYVFLGQQNIHLVILICISMTSSAHLDIEIKRGNTEKVENGTGSREKRMIEAIGAKISQLGLRAGRYLPYYLRVRKAKSILVADAEFLETKIALEGHKVFKYKKQGGCSRAEKDFRMTNAANIESEVEKWHPLKTEPLVALYKGVVGYETISFLLDTFYNSGCHIRIGRPPTPGRKSGDVIYVHYPET